MPAPTYSDIKKFADSADHVSNEARRAFLAAAETVDFSDWSSAAEQLRQIVDEVVIAYGSAAAELGAQWYEYCRGLNFTTPYTAKYAELNHRGVKFDADEKIDMLFDGSMSESQLAKALSEVVAANVYGMARNTINENLEYEYRKAVSRGDWGFAKKSGYARVASGDACAFCILMASQGFYYTSEKTAGEQYHGNCKCTAVPYANAKDIKGYSDRLSGYQSMYDDADSLRRSGDMPDELKDRISKAKEEHQRKYAAGETKSKWSPTLNENAIIMRWQHEGLH